MASRTDYKFSHISRRDNGTMEVKVRFYEGEVSTLDEEDMDGRLVPVTRYRRSALVKRPLTHFASLDGVSSRLIDDGNAGVLTFNRHLTDDQLRVVMNDVLAKDLTRIAIDEQKAA